ncbi:MAG: hypothetical protein EXR92_00790 [Gemmatimonadetes bacterium]|nr:hypothetical protein [Gemmatimonadota bacterium]
MPKLNISRVGTITVVAACLFTPREARAQESGTGPCPAGRVTEVVVRNGSVFDPASTESWLLATAYRAANLAHVRTREDFIRSELLLSEGDCFDQRLALDSQLILDRYGFLRQAQLTAEDDGRGGWRLVVETSDEWSLGMEVGITYDEGLNLEVLHLWERNFLGRGISADLSVDKYRDRNDRGLRLFTPRFFGRSEASISWGRARRGEFLGEAVSYPFVGETGRYSLRQAYSRAPWDFTYAARGSEGFSHVVVESRREVVELGAARRFGEPDRSTIVGITLLREEVGFSGTPEIVPGRDPGSEEGIARQRRSRGSTRLALHLGTRRYTYREYEGLDAVRETQTVGLGFFAGVTVGVGIGLLVPGGLPEDSGPYLRGHASFGRAWRASLLHGGVTVEGRHGDGWRDVLTEADLVGYGRASWLPGQTIFARASAAGGWRTEVPFQLTLGGRDGVRAFLEDQFPGGRQLLFTLEDRIALPWPRWTIGDLGDLGVTLLGDLGRVWPGDAPYGVDSGWKGGAGLGLRIAFPSGSRAVWRPDLFFPVGPDAGDPVFRLTVELNRYRNGFFTPELSRSRQFRWGPEHF